MSVEVCARVALKLANGEVGAGIIGADDVLECVREVVKMITSGSCVLSLIQN